MISIFNDYFCSLTFWIRIMKRIGIMKTIFFALVAAGIIMMSACGKEATVNNNQTDTTTQKTNLLLGKWFYTTDSLKYYTSGTLDSTKVSTYYQSDNIVFNANLTGIETRSGIANDFKYTVSNKDVVFSFNGPIQQSIKQKTDGLHTLSATGTVIPALVRQISTTDMVLVYQSTSGSQTIDEVASFTKQQ